MERKNIKIDEKTFNVLKKYCKKNGLKIYSWVSKTILEKIKQESKNDNLQNNKSNK